ncbi:uncharacterized protein H6S33_002684 [Morchella sextelata]|uniref:uncharacterized protein n=1 Tax=Morchella sextelata TaxID=1174677 RepID=UPI001D049F96|nr:uncharacterized protein H6S33_002684 [Morchella sextelata]KAH0607650.1 hypothetical protein H6S33_002684 [Morchella sextelata]
MVISNTASIGFLPRADGSGSFVSGRTSIIASVTGPMEVRIRDELPQKSHVEVIVRPAIGVTSTREKYLEARLLSALKPLILRSNHPRTLIQIVVQVVQTAGTDENASTTLLLLAPAMNAAVLALLDAAVPLKSVLAATTVAFMKGSGGVVVEPGLDELKNSSSTHVLAFTSTGQLGFVESDGEFEYEDFERVVEAGRRVCSVEQKGHHAMDMGAKYQAVGELIRKIMSQKVEKDMRWRA